MGKNKARHILHGVLDCLPIILIPIFMIYSQNHEINDNTLQVQENKVVDFNQNLQELNNDYWTAYNTNNVTLTFNNSNQVQVEIIANAGNGSDAFMVKPTYYTDSIANHKYIAFTYYELISGNTSLYPLLEYNSVYSSGQSLGNNRWYFYWTANVTNPQTYFYLKLSYGQKNIGDTWKWSNVMCTDLTLMFGEGNEPTAQDYISHFPNSYYPYTESEEVVIENYETITYNDTDIMSQSFYCLYNAVDKYFNMGNVFGMKNLYTWFEVNIFGGTASPSIYIVWNIVLYEFIMDLLFLLYGLFMFFIDLCKRLMEKPLNSIK